MRERLRRAFSRQNKTCSRPGNRKIKSTGQSLVELTLTLPLILMLFSGLVEFGFMLNYYLSLLDATRFVAREYSGGDPFLYDSNGNITGDNTVKFYSPAVNQVIAQLEPQQLPTGYFDNTRKIVLDSATDNVIITVFSVDADGNITDYPPDGPYEWNPNFQGNPVVTDAVVQNQLISGAPCEGMVSVEVDYTYHQILNLPWMAWLGNPILPAYTIMPLQAAEPQC
ncbi:MAG TPA: TadE family protein [Anaerolineales bacterium]|nr:TadE family protein [Anaerolineales bacterium]